MGRSDEKLATEWYLNIIKMIKLYSQSADVLKQMKQVSEMTPAEPSTEYTTWDPGQSHVNMLVAHGLAFIWHQVI